MTDNDRIAEQARERVIEDREILKEVRADIKLLTEIRYRIIKRKLHRQIMDLIEDAVESGRVPITSAEEIRVLTELGLVDLKGITEKLKEEQREAETCI